MMRIITPLLSLAIIALAVEARGAEHGAMTGAGEKTVVDMHLVDDTGKKIAVGRITARQSPWGVIFEPELSSLIPGVHGFHLHEKPSCEPAVKDGKKTAAGGAGGHFDPKKTNKHAGPYGDGHLGDLPNLVVVDGGRATMPVLAPRIKLADLKGRSLVMHEHGDNYTDQPTLGGSGGRVACGVVK